MTVIRTHLNHHKIPVVLWSCPNCVRAGLLLYGAGDGIFWVSMIIKCRAVIYSLNTGGYIVHVHDQIHGISLLWHDDFMIATCEMCNQLTLT